MSAPQNRKQRRAAAAAASTSSATDSTFDPSSIPLARAPEYTGEATSKPKAKTLFELAAEREAELFPSSSKSPSGTRAKKTEYVEILPSGELSHIRPSSSSHTDSLSTTASASRPSSSDAEGPSITRVNARDPDVEEEDETIPPLADTILYSLPLCALHFTLGFLAAHQYAQDIEVGKLIWDSALVAFPMLTFMIHFAHGHVISFKIFDRLLWGRGNRATSSKTTSFVLQFIFPPAPKTLFFLPLAVFLGFRLIALTNDSPYYAVMKRAPAIGTLWVWCVLEMPAGAAVLALLIPIGYGMWEGYRLI